MLKYNIKIYDTNMRELARLQNAFDTGYDLVNNELWTCRFKMPKNDKKIKFCEAFNYVELFDGEERVELFRIMPSVFTRNELAYEEFECEHVLATLIDDVLFQYHQIGNVGVYTPQVLRYVLDKQTNKRWQLVECDFNRQFEYKWENENLLAALFSVPKCFNEKYKWVFDTTTQPWGLSLKRLDEKYKADIQYRKNMQNIEKTKDPTNIVTRLYALGYGEGDNQLTIKSVNNGVPYIEKNVGSYGLKNSILIDRRFESPTTLLEYAKTVLNEASQPYLSYKIKAVDLSVIDINKYPKFLPGDFVLIRDVEDEINLKLPIVKVSKSDLKGNPFDIEIEIANKNKDITGSISEIMERSRINDTYAQGATNLMQIAFNDNADEKYPALIKFYIPSEMARINKLILNYTLESFRAYSKATKGGGETRKTTGSGGGDYTSTGAGGGDYTSTGSGGGDYDTTHGMAQVNGDNVQRVVKNFQQQHIGFAEDYHVYSHEHSISLRPHEHSVNIPQHTHSVNIPQHTHDFTLPDHTHDIDYGMYEGSKASEAYLRVDGQTVYIKDKEVNLIPHLSKDDGGKIQRGTWHTIEIVPNKLTRINASVFIQLFTTSRGGGDF
ncbi:MAG: phage tail spike protein [Peptoniphilus sp.]|uniref:phage tail spike protein n=1 Tax=Peptoniphilus sp. TaxID=1971214 RepID=UPI002A755E97|nr:phage tail spike protein [Peptoniphilus sp.]MDY2986141.1 phage tail spike protein [Peptoniphilus sp.]